MNIHIKDTKTFLTALTDIVSDSLTSSEPLRLAGFLHLQHQTRRSTSRQDPKDRWACSSHCHTLPEGKILKAKASAFKETARKSEKCSPQKTEPSRLN